jgi:hypothetical protein
MSPPLGTEPGLTWLPPRIRTSAAVQVDTSDTSEIGLGEAGAQVRKPGSRAGGGPCAFPSARLVSIARKIPARTKQRQDIPPPSTGPTRSSLCLVPRWPTIALRLGTSGGRLSTGQIPRISLFPILASVVPVISCPGSWGLRAPLLGQHCPGGL